MYPNRNIGEIDQLSITPKMCLHYPTLPNPSLFDKKNSVYWSEYEY